MPGEAAGSAGAKRRELGRLTRLFLRLGVTAFGGPAAHVAIMEDEVVARRKWLTREEFVDLLGATNLIPGPNSTEMAIHIGHRRAGFAGLVVAGTCFILPAAILVGAMAWGYVRFGALPQVTSILYAVKPVVVVIVLQALWRLSRAALKDKVCIAVALLAIVAGFLNVHELLILFGAGVATPVIRDLVRHGRRGVWPPLLVGVGSAASFPTTAAAVGAAVPFGLWALFLFFLKVGAVLFGSGYVLLAFLRADLVERWHWLTEGQLLDAVAVGQITPGPVFTTATFIGYVLAGATGAVVATIGIFLPAFFFVAISGPLVPRLRRSAIAGGVLDGVNAGSLALMAVVTWHLGRAAVHDGTTVLMAIAAGVLLWRWKVNSAWLIPGGGVVGLVLGQLW